MSVLDLGRINGESYKAIVTIPGWQADQIWRRGETSPQELAKIYTASVWAYACISLRADAMTMIEWEIALEGQEDSPLSPRHPLVRLLQEVNPEMNYNDLIRATESDLNIYGTGYWLKARTGGGRTRGLMRLNPSTIELIASASGIQGFKQHLNGVEQAERYFPREDVIYFREYDPLNDLGGLSKLQVAMSSASAGINTEEYTAAFFKNYAIPPIVFSSDAALDESTLNRLVDWWRRRFSGKKNQHKAGFVTHGMKPNIIGYPTKDLALGELMNEVRRNISAVFRVPPAVVGAWEAANYAASKEQVQFLYRNTLKPRCEYLSGVLEAELFNEFQPGLQMNWRFDKLEVMAEDKKVEAERHAILVYADIEDPEAAAEELEVQPRKQPRPQVDQTNAPQNIVRRPQIRSNGHFHNELNQLERWIIRRMEKGKMPLALEDFDAKYIPLTLKNAIEGQLELVKVPGDVTEIMQAASAWKGYP